MTKDFSIKPYVEGQVGFYDAKLAPQTFDKEQSFTSPETQSSGTLKVHSESSGRILMPTAGIKAGAKLEYKNWFADASATAGNIVKFDAKAGYNIDLNKTFGLELSAQAQHTIVAKSKETPGKIIPNSKENFEKTMSQYATIDKFNPPESGVLGGLTRQNVISESNPVSETRYTAGAAIEYKPNKNVSVKFGARAGYRNVKSEMTTNYAMEAYSYKSTPTDGLKDFYCGDENSGITQTENQGKFFFTPEIEAKAKLGDKFYLKGQVDTTQLSAGFGITL